jgi:hypothetical protein
MVRSLFIIGLLLVRTGDFVWAQIQVLSPQSLLDQLSATKGRIQGSTAVFGAPFYGDEVFGRVVYGDSKNCGRYDSTDGLESEAMKNCHQHCHQDEYDIPKPEVRSTEESSEMKLINIVALKRGKCAFTKKVKVAQEYKDAHAVIIVDKEESTYTTKDLETVIVADDGHGDNISIPSILVSKEDGRKLLAALQKPTPVIVQLSWDIPTNHVVHMDLWMSSASQQSLKFLKDFAERRKTLNEVVSFQPHFAVFSEKPYSMKAYQELCWDAEAKYCAEDPDGAGDITGRAVLEEDLRQLCIHNQYKVARTSELSLKAGKKVEYAKEFWDYVEKRFDRCTLDGKGEDKFGTECSEKLMREVNIDVPAIQSCMLSKKDEYLKYELDNPAWSPRALRINGWRYKGFLDADLVTRAICQAFVQKPPECTDLLKPRDPTVRYVQGNKTPGGVSFGSFILILAVTVGIFSIAVLCYKRSLTASVRTVLREEVMLEVQAQMGEYKQLQR